LKKRKVFEFTTLIILILGDDNLKKYWICKHTFFLKALGSNWVNCLPFFVEKHIGIKTNNKKFMTKRNNRQIEIIKKIKFPKNRKKR